MRVHDDVVARGRRTIIRRKRLTDARDEYRWRSDPELAQFDASRPVQTAFDTYLRNWSFDYRFTDMAGRSFAIEDENGCHIGNIMYYNIDTVRSEAEIGISIGERDRWSQGYGSDAVEALGQALLRAGVVMRLYLHTLDWNRRAQRAFGILRTLGLDRLVQRHRSTSPMTVSREPTIAIMSAISASLMHVAVASSATKDGARNLTRHGFGPPSEQT